MPRRIAPIVALFALFGAGLAHAASSTSSHTDANARTDGGSAAPQKYKTPQNGPTVVQSGVADTGKVPLVLQSPNAQEREDPGIGKPVEPGVDCFSGELSAQERGNLREAHVNPQKSCLPQTDAFKRAAEAASYLAIYQQHFSQYGRQMQDPVHRKEIQDAVMACVNNDPKCSEQNKAGAKTRHDLLQALVQHNFAKDLKAQVIENESRAERMKSMDTYFKKDPSLGAITGIPTKVLSWNNSLHTAHVVERSFRIDPRQLAAPFDPSKVSDQERILLGKEFNNSFDSFVDAYTSSEGKTGPKSRWHYVEAKTSALGSQGVIIAAPDNRNQDIRQGKSAIDQSSLRADIRSENAAKVQEIVASYKKEFRDVNAPTTILQTVTDDTATDKSKQITQRPIDSLQAASEETGFGLDQQQLAKIGQPGDAPRSAKDVADLVVVSINRAITLTENNIEKNSQARIPSSVLPNGAKRIITPSVSVNMKEFDNFLNDIWPAGAKPQQPE